MANETTTKTVASGTHLNAAGTVKTVIGLVKAIDVNGNERVLQTGDHVYPGETIQTAGDGAVLVEFPNGGHLDLPHSSHIVLDADIYAPTDSAEKQAEDEATRIERAIAEGRDPSIETDAAAAGGTGGDEGSSTPLVLNFNNTQGAVDSGFQTAPLSNSFNSAQQDQQPTIPEAAPSITAATPGGTVLELANTTGSSAQDAASGTISFTDINPADVHTVSVKAEGTNYLGTFTPTLVADSTQTANGAGTVGWTFNVQDGALDFLAAGQTLTQKYDVTISDGQGGTATQVVTITITGTNDAPVFVGSSEEQSDLPPNSALVSEQANVTGEESADSASGQLRFVDVDLTDAHTISDVKSQGENYLGTFTPVITADSTGGGVGVVSWTYSVPDSALDFLAAGQVLTQKYDVTINDGNGGTATETVTITIVGTNDAPVITSSANDAVGAVKEDTTTSASGQLTASDVDNGATQTWSINEAEGGPSAAGQYGSLTVDAQTGAWTYTLNNDAQNVQSLAAGESHDETFTVRVTDDQGATAEQVVTITVTGTNDAPVITSSANDAVGAVKEDTTTSASGQLTASDVDNGATQTWSINEAEGGPSAAGQYGSLTVDAQTGAWTYTLNNDAKNVQSLAAGESHDETFTVRVTDDQGATAEQTVTITVTGTNDAPVITSSANDAVGAVKEDTTTSVSGQLTASDVDNGATQTWSINEAEGGPSAAGQYGSLTVDAQTGAWTYTLNNDAKNVQSLAAGESHDETFTVRVTDDQGATAEQVVTITLTGTNDAPVITSTANDAVGAVKEDTTTSASGQLTASDVDNGATQTWSINEAEGGPSAAGQYGSLTVDAQTGAWTYTLNNDAKNVQSLAAGESHDETFTVRVTDDQGATAEQVVTITVTGTNDAPVITSNAAAAQGSVTEAGNLDDGSAVAGVATATGTLTSSDVDNGATATWSIDGKSSYGSIAIDAATGKWTYTLDNTLEATQGLKEGDVKTETFTATVTDEFGAMATQVVTITINGTNDAPVAIAANAQGKEDASGISIQLSGSDVDGTVASFTIGSLPTHGTLYFGANEVHVGDSIPATSNGATLTFVPTHDWSGDTSFSYNAVDNNGAVSVSSATANISVLPVADTPVVTIDIGQVTHLTQTIDVSNVTSTDSGFKVAAFDINGNPATVSIHNDAAHNVVGFGVSGNVAGNNGAADEIGSNGSQSEKVVVTFDAAANDVKVSFSWLNSKETAHYVVKDAAGNVISSGDVKGVTDQVDQTFGVEGKLIKSIEFTAGSQATDDYLVNHVTFTTGSTYAVTLDVKPTDIDYSEKVTSVKVEAPEGAVLSAGTIGSTVNGVTTWELPLTDNGNYHVTTDPATGEVHVTGLTVTVPTALDNTPFEVKVVGTVQDGPVDGVTDTTSATASAIAPIDHAPVGMPDSYAAVDGSKNSFTSILSNDTDQDGDKLMVTVVSSNGNGPGLNVDGIHSITTTLGGTVTMNADGTFSYQAPVNHANDQSPTDSFYYKVGDGTLASDWTKVTINLSNAAPVANTDNATNAANDKLTTSEDTPLTIAPATLLANDTDVEGDPLTITNVQNPTHGMVALGQDGNIVYTPDANYNGPASFTYTISDGHGGTATATVNVNVTPVNDAPVASAISVQGNEDSTGISIQLSGSDIDGTVASFTIGTLPDHGTLYLGKSELHVGDTVPASGNGATVTFVPTHDWSGSTSFAYIAVDNNGAGSTSAQASITVNPVTDTPSVNLTVAVQTPFDSYAVDVTSVASALANTTDNIAQPAGFTITAYDQNGNVGQIFTSKNTGTTGFGVVGEVKGNDSADGVEISGNEKIVVQLDNPATSVSYQIALLRGSDKDGGAKKMEYADVTVHYSDGTSETRVISGDETNVNGHSDKVSPVFTVDAPSGKTITSIDFQADSTQGTTPINNDFWVHSLSYKAATQTFSVGITATPGDSDYSEHISQPLNVMITDESGKLITDAKLVGYAQNSDGSFSIPLNDSHVSVDAKTGAVSVSDLSVTVSTDVHSFKITATATAQDGTAAPASNSDTVHVVSGTVGDDALQAGTGDSILVGGAGNDTLVGSAGNDILVGSSGDDLLTGGKGSNAFVWKSGETGSDTITDFKVGDGGDVLNLSDVLHGEHSNAASLDNYLTFSINKSGDTVISIHADGAGSAVTQTITLQGVDLVTGHDSTSIINNLLGHGNLKTDA